MDNYYYARRRYWNARDLRLRRGDVWNLTFEQWYQWYLDQGIDKNYSPASQQPRTAGPNRGVMVRRNPSRPWSLGNIDYQLGPSALNIPVTGTRNGRSRSIRTPDGTFGSINQAAVYYNITHQSMRERIQRHPEIYRYE